MELHLPQDEEPTQVFHDSCRERQGVKHLEDPLTPRANFFTQLHNVSRFINTTHKQVRGPQALASRQPFSTYRSARFVAGTRARIGQGLGCSPNPNPEP